MKGQEGQLFNKGHFLINIYISYKHIRLNMSILAEKLLCISYLRLN